MSEPPSPPRKRAAVACDYCRRRKRRCDGVRPACSLCRDTSHECHYEESDTAKNAMLSALLRRLETVEAELARKSSTTPSAERIPSSGRATLVDDFCLQRATCDQSTSDNFEPSHIFPQPEAQLFAQRSCESLLASPRAEGNVSTQERIFSNCSPALISAEPTDITIPASHTTTTGSILQTAPAKAFLGTYPRDLFLRTESRRQLPEQLDLGTISISPRGSPDLDPSITKALIDSFFRNVHIQVPILHRPSLQAFQDRSILEGVQDEMETAVLLLVLALGKVSSEQAPPTTKEIWMPGAEYLAPALRYLLPAFLSSFGVDVNKPQALFLAAVYYSYIMRPLQAWRLVNMASTTLQQVWLRYESAHGLAVGHSGYQPMLRLCWSIFKLESDILAEYHLPSSGIERFVEKLPFPTAYEPESPPYFLSWLADLSARVLLNRVHNSMYGRKGQHAVSPEDFSVDTDDRSSMEGIDRPMVQVPLELNRQLHNWYGHLPPSVRPDIDEFGRREVFKVILQLRFHATGEIIFRPFLYQVLNLPQGATISSDTLQHCETCILHCRNYIQVVHERLDAPSAQTEIVLHSTLAATLLMTLCSLCFHTKHLVSDIDDIQGHAIGLVRQWSSPGSCIESMLSLLVTMRDKCRADREFASP